MREERLKGTYLSRNGTVQLGRQLREEYGPRERKKASVCCTSYGTRVSLPLGIATLVADRRFRLRGCVRAGDRMGFWRVEGSSCHSVVIGIGTNAFLHSLLWRGF